MKILLVCKSLPHRAQGGIQSHVWQLTEQLVAFGHTVSILTAGTWGLGEQRYRLDGRHIIEVAYFPMHHSPILPVFLEDWAFNRAVNRWLTTNGFAYDIIHLQGRSGFTFEPTETCKTPIVSTLHGFMATENRHEGKTSWFNLDSRLHQFWASRHERRSLQRASKIIATSDAIIEDIKNHIKNPIECAEILSKTKKISAGSKATESTTPSVFRPKNAPLKLLFVGSLQRRKGVYPLLEAMRLVKQPVNLTFIGDGAAQSKLVRQSLRWGLLGRRVSFTGALPNEGVLQELKRGDALILPAFQDNQSMALMEANACGKPILASDIEGIRSIVTHGENGWLFPPHNPQAMADAIDKLALAPHEARTMGETGRIKMRLEFDWEKIVFQTLATYQQILRGGKKITEPLKID